jgi:hypothetical protein
MPRRTREVKSRPRGREEPAVDSAAFDRLTTTFATSGTRRAMVGLALSGLLAGLGHETAPAKNKKDNGKDKKGCPKGKKKCGKKCISKKSCCNYFDCTGCRNEDCISGKCRCGTDLIMHNGMCGLFINCKSFGEPCTDHDECCGTTCIDDGSGQTRCDKSKYHCLTDNDCLSGSCQGFLCPEAHEPYFELCR